MIPDRHLLSIYLKMVSDRRYLEAHDDIAKAYRFKLLKVFDLNKTIRGMSNSEVALAFSLWAVWKKKVDFEYVSLRDHFLPSGKAKSLDELKETLVSANAVLLSGPVYFGDRCSLIQSFINMLKTDKSLLERLRGKFYGGISIGAKRNGGQETTLIYQILDMISLGFIAVGNDSETTAQYGGTCVAGSVGSLVDDEYGIDTAMGVGRRLANLVTARAHGGELLDKPKILFLILQDDYNGLAIRYVDRLMEKNRHLISAKSIDLTRMQFIQCLACDVCPEKIDLDEVYRCKIGESDDFYDIHKQLMDFDAIVPVAASTVDFSAIRSNYQIFLERTRYLRRGDYFFSDLIFAPLVIQEIGTMDNMHVRMITSFIRHHTLVSKPIIGYYSQGKMLNEPEMAASFASFINKTSLITAARLSDALMGGASTLYNPVGYIVSPAKKNKQKNLSKRQMVVNMRHKRVKEIAKSRVRFK